MYMIQYENWSLMGKRILVDCPGCEKRFMLDHNIDKNGQIHPSLDCPICDFHESNIILAGWNERK